MNNSIIFFDGHCNLCNVYVDLLIRIDRSMQFVFAPLQGETASKLLSDKLDQFGDSIVLLNPDNTLAVESTAVLEIVSRCVWYLRWVTIFKLIPLGIRNWCYQFIARNRYRLFGKKDTCRIPTEQERERFLP